MRVLHLTTEYPPIIYGGLGTAVGGLAVASARAGIDVGVLLVGEGSTPSYPAMPSPRPTSLVSRIDTDGIVIHAVHHSEAVAASIRVVRAWKPDLVHVHVFWLAHVATAIREETGVPLVYTVHSLDRAEYELGEGPPECLVQWNIQSDLIHAADRIVALTVDERELIATYCAPARTRIRIVGNGIDDSRTARVAASRPRRDGPVTVLYSGRLVDRKGIKELLEAAPHVLRASPTARFVVAGGHRHCIGEEMACRWLPECCASVRDRIHFTGWLTPEALNGWYAAADVLVVPSWYEPFGMVILEGMLYGLAIVASDVGGPRAMLHHDENGLLCQPRDVGSLTSALQRVIADYPLRVRLGRRAAQCVRAQWLFRTVVARMRLVYDEVIAA